MSFETICFLVFGSIFLSVILIGVGICIGGTYEKMDKNIHRTKPNGTDNNNVLCNNPDNSSNRTVGNFYQPIDCGQDLESDPEAERIINILQTMYALSCGAEREALEYSMDCIMLKVRLLKMFEERGIE